MAPAPVWNSTHHTFEMGTRPPLKTALFNFYSHADTSCLFVLTQIILLATSGAKLFLYKHYTCEKYDFHLIQYNFFLYHAALNKTFYTYVCKYMYLNKIILYTETFMGLLIVCCLSTRKTATFPFLETPKKCTFLPLYFVNRPSLGKWDRRKYQHYV